MINLLEKEGLGVKAQRICMDNYFQIIFLQKYLGVRRTTKSEFLVVLIQFLVVEDTPIFLACLYSPGWSQACPFSTAIFRSLPIYQQSSNISTFM